MGIKFGFSEDRYSESNKLGSFSRDRYLESNSSLTPSNPNPCNWLIKNYKTIGNYLIVMIRYPDCSNYEGNKILVYENITINALRTQVKIDPHFSENKNYKSPIARFEPTNRGWKMAETFCNSMKGV